MTTMMLRVRAAGDSLVPNQEKPSGHAQRYVGREFAGMTAEGALWAPMAEPTELPDRPEYRHALVAGDLEAADEATAKAVGVEWKAAPQARAPKNALRAEGGS